MAVPRQINLRSAPVPPKKICSGMNMPTEADSVYCAGTPNLAWQKESDSNVSKHYVALD